MKSESVVVRVPGSTSNLGSGFDTLGLALQLYNQIRVSRAAKRGVQIVSEVLGAAQPRAVELASEAAALFFKRTGASRFGIAVESSGEVPIGRGLGASATLRTGVVAGLSALVYSRVNRQQVLDIVTELEGHPDNASPAILGGFTVSGRVERAVTCIRFQVSPKLKFVTLIPPFQVNTELARKLLPGKFSRADAAHGLNRAAVVAAAFASRNYEQLRGFFDDRIHQPARAQLVPGLKHIIHAGEKAGAIGGWLSGSGSSIICLTVDKARAVADAMQREMPEADVRILRADNAGLRIM